MPWNVQVGHGNTQNYLQDKRNIKKNYYIDENQKKIRRTKNQRSVTFWKKY